MLRINKIKVWNLIGLFQRNSKLNVSESKISLNFYILAASPLVACMALEGMGHPPLCYTY